MIANKFDGQLFRLRMHLIKEKYLASLRDKRKASLRASNENSSYTENTDNTENTKNTSRRTSLGISNKNSSNTENTHKHSLTLPATPTKTETTASTTPVQKDAKLNASTSTAASSTSNQSSQLMNLLASQGPQVTS